MISNKRSNNIYFVLYSISLKHVPHCVLNILRIHVLFLSSHLSEIVLLCRCRRQQSCGRSSCVSTDSLGLGSFVKFLQDIFCATHQRGLFSFASVGKLFRRLFSPSKSGGFCKQAAQVCNIYFLREILFACQGQKTRRLIPRYTLRTSNLDVIVLIGL